MEIYEHAMLRVCLYPIWYKATRNAVVRKVAYVHKKMFAGNLLRSSIFRSK